MTGGGSAPTFDRPLLGGEHEEEPLLPRRREAEEARFDITAMIDLVFMMNIYFLVTTVAQLTSELDLPSARHVMAADLDTCFVVSLVSTGDASPPEVYLGDGRTGEQVGGADLEERVRQAVQNSGLTDVVIKAEGSVLSRHVARVAAAAAIEDVKLHLAVLEAD
jgi:biopolymer transport protein ExbD